MYDKNFPSPCRMISYSYPKQIYVGLSHKIAYKEFIVMMRSDCHCSEHSELAAHVERVTQR